MSLKNNAPVFRSTTRIVVVDVVAVDQHGNPVTDLKQDEFQVYEHLNWFRRVPERIAHFRAVGAPSQRPVTIQQPRPNNQPSSASTGIAPTILLVDAANTRGDGVQNVTRRMGEIIDAIPPGVPVAVCAMGHRLYVIQNFTTDHTLLNAAASTAFSRAYDPSDRTSDFVLSVLQVSPGADPIRPYRTAARRFENIFTQIAKSMAAVPGRKNLIWISDSLPTAIPAKESFWGDSIQPALDALSNARVAMYPIKASGIEPGGGCAGRGTPRQCVSDPAHGFISPALMDYMRDMTAQTAADRTGGKACVDPENLAGCVKTAMNHGLSYYEISYYPTAKSWLSGYHGILIKTTRPGVRLTYRRGYTVGDHKPRHDPSKPLPEQTKRDPELETAACGDSLTPNTLSFSVQPAKSERPGWVKYSLLLSPTRLIFNDAADNKRRLRLDYAICTFDKSGMPIKYMQHDFEQSFTDAEFNWLMQHGFPHDEEFLPSKDVAGLRLVVRDEFSGLFGSTNLKYPSN